MTNTVEWDMPRVGRYLRVGERVIVNGKKYRVDMVNSCRARCVPVVKEVASYTDGRTGALVSYRFTGKSINIAPTTERPSWTSHEKQSNKLSSNGTKRQSIHRSISIRDSG